MSLYELAQKENSKITGLLENWYVVRVSEDEFIIQGEIWGDIKGRFPNGTFIHTSGILNRDVAEGCVVETRNSVYKLGKMRNYSLD